jgi:hypothetical protein
MKNHPNAADPAELVRTIKDFLDSQSLQQQENARCAQCGAEIRYIHALFWLVETQMAWDIQLPSCPSCDLAIPKQGCHTAAVMYAA